MEPELPSCPPASAPPAGWALVTGGSGELGAASARALAADGWPVAVTYRSQAGAAHALVDELAAAGARALAIPAELRDPAAVDAAFAEVETRGGPVLVLVNSLGARADMLTLHLDDAAWTAVLETNLTAVFRATRRALPQMVRARWGRVISLASVAGVQASSGQANYVAAKAGLIGFTRTVAVEVAARGVTVNAVAPGFIPTRFNAELRPEVALTIPARRFGTVHEVAACVRFLASAEAAYVTGTTLVVDGGLSA
jgi:3-oxoacyl-[acyl-carrier protein] reductase